jgi:hypothetical protein
LTVVPSVTNGTVNKPNNRKFDLLVFFLGRSSVLFVDDHRATNGSDAIIDMNSAGTLLPSSKQQLQVIDETV